jgi:hypothetical protein
VPLAQHFVDVCYMCCPPHPTHKPSSSTPFITQNLANNELSGGLSSLPATLKLLNLSANALDGQLPTRLPPSLTVLDLSLNKITGEALTQCSAACGALTQCGVVLYHVGRVTVTEMGEGHVSRHSLSVTFAHAMRSQSP